MFFWRILTPVLADRLTFQQGDFTLQFLAYRQLAFQQIQLGVLPVFEECLYSGYPFQADPQSQVLYPPVLGFMLLGRALGWSAYPLRALEWEVLLHVLIAALSMYAFLRTGPQPLRRLAALFGASAFAFSGFMTGYAMLQTAILQTAAWLPLVMLALRGLAFAHTPQARTTRSWLGYAALLAAGVFLMFTAGHPQTLLFAIYAGVAAFIVWARQAALPVRHMLLRGGVAGGLAIGLAAVQLIPLFMFTLQSTRTSVSFDEASAGLPLHHIALFFLTGNFVSTWQSLYVGVPTLLLAGLAVVWPAHPRDTWLWLGIVLSALALSFGANALGFDVAYWAAPGYKQFRAQERHAVIVAFAVCVLGAYGLHMLLHPLRPRTRLRLRHAARRLGGWAALACAVLLGLIVYTRVAAVQDNPTIGAIADRVAILCLGLLGTAGLWGWRTRLRAPKWLWASGLLALLVFDLFSINRYTATQKPAEPFPKLDLLAPISAQAPEPGTRVYNHYGLPLNAACIAGLSEIGGGSPILLRRYKDFLARTPEDVYTRLLNVRYTFSWRGGMGTDNGKQIPAHRIAQGQYNGVNANTWALDWEPQPASPAWIAQRITAVENDDALYAALGENSFDPFSEVVVYTSDTMATPDWAQANNGTSTSSKGGCRGHDQWLYENCSL